MKQKRIFLGSFTHHPELFKLWGHTKEILQDTSVIKWTRRPENLHFTLHFFGDMPIDKIIDLQKILSGIIEVNHEILFQITSLKFFKRKGKPAVLYAHIDDTTGELEKLYLEIQEILFQNGFVEHIKTSFVPHITFGRIKKVSPLFYEEIDSLNKNFKIINFDKFCPQIIESVLSPEGALYRPLKI